MRSILIFLVLVVGLSACDNRPEASKEWSQTLDFEPRTLDPGSNTLQIDLPQTAASFAKANDMDPEAIQEVKLLSCEIYLEDGNTFDEVGTVLLQLASANADMNQYAIAEVKEDGAKRVKLDIAEDNDAAAHFSSDKVIAVIEMDVEDGGETTYKFKMDVKFKFISKQNQQK